VLISINLDRAVTDTQYYPDFHVDQYFGADIDSNPDRDLARIVLEVGSLGKNKLHVHRQLSNYMDVIGPIRSRGMLLGVGLVGNEVLLIHRGDNGTKVLFGGWISMFDPKFVSELDKMRSFCVNDDMK